jgi:soluble lytic murein transglycosylase-like protein
LLLAVLAGLPCFGATVVKSARSVVRVDARTGRLVRAVIVTPRQIQAQPAESRAYSTNTSQSNAEADVLDLVKQTAEAHDVDPLLVESVIAVESNFDQYAVSPKGAQGLMQLIPATARRFGAANSFNAQQNIEAGVKYLKHLTTLYPQDVRLALAAYNAGEGAVAKYGNNIPPYRETENYVYKVGRKYGNARREADRKKTQQVAARTSLKPAVPEYRPIRQFIDQEGRLHLRTVEAENTP